jgi:hypothetical protein
VQVLTKRLSLSHAGNLTIDNSAFGDVIVVNKTGVGSGLKANVDWPGPGIWSINTFYGGSGVNGEANATYGTGVEGDANGQYGSGVVGNANGDNGTGVAGYGKAIGVSGKGSVASADWVRTPRIRA